MSLEFDKFIYDFVLFTFKTIFYYHIKFARFFNLSSHIIPFFVWFNHKKQIICGTLLDIFDAIAVLPFHRMFFTAQMCPHLSCCTNSAVQMLLLNFSCYNSIFEMAAMPFLCYG